MQISYNEERNGYEVFLTAEEKVICAPTMERYGFKWSEQKKIYWATENEQSSMFLQIVNHLKGAEINLPKKLSLPVHIRNFFSRGNYNFADIAIMSGVSVEEVKLKAVEMYSDTDLQRMGLYEKIIDHDAEYAVMSCISLFPDTENKAIMYLLKEQGIQVSESCLAAIRKKNGYANQPKNKDGERPRRNVSNSNDTQKTPAGESNGAEKPMEQKQKKQEEEWEAISVSAIRKQYYDEHENCTSIHVREALAAGKFDIPLIAKKAEVKEETVKCKIVEILSKEQLQKYGFFHEFLPSQDDENKIVTYVNRQTELPETWELKRDVEKTLGIEVSLSALKAVLKKNEIKENNPEVVYRPKRKGR